MRKLVIAVIVFSFLGFGPLKTLFHHENSSNGKLISQLKNTSQEFLRDNGKVINFINEAKKMLEGAINTIETELGKVNKYSVKNNE